MRNELTVSNNHRLTVARTCLGKMGGMQSNGLEEGHTCDTVIFKLFTEMVANWCSVTEGLQGGAI